MPAGVFLCMRPDKAPNLLADLLNLPFEIVCGHTLCAVAKNNDLFQRV